MKYMNKIETFELECIYYFLGGIYYSFFHIYDCFLANSLWNDLVFEFKVNLFLVWSHLIPFHFYKIISQDKKYQYFSMPPDYVWVHKWVLSIKFCPYLQVGELN